MKFYPNWAPMAVSKCRFSDYGNSEMKWTFPYWNIMLERLLFCILFILVIFTLIWIRGSFSWINVVNLVVDKMKFLLLQSLSFSTKNIAGSSLWFSRLFSGILFCWNTLNKQGWLVDAFKYRFRKKQLFLFQFHSWNFVKVLIYCKVLTLVRMVVS